MNQPYREPTARADETYTVQVNDNGDVLLAFR